MVRNRTVRTPKKRAAFLEGLASSASVTTACLLAGFGRRSAYDWRAADEDFAADWEDALEAGTDLMEDEMRRRAVEGVDEPRFHDGQICGHVRKCSDSLLIFMLKARRPDKYRDRAEVSHTGKVAIIMNFGDGA